MIFDKNQCPYCETKCDDIVCPCAKFKAYLDVKNPEILYEELKNLGIEDNMNKFEKILHIQKHFASRFHSVENIKKEETDYWLKEYGICIEDEIEEVFDYIKLDDNNEIKTNALELKKEIADILHFVLDSIISSQCSANIIINLFKEKYLQKEYNNDPLVDMFNFCINYLQDTFDIKRNDSNDCTKMWNFAGKTNKWNDVLQTISLRLLFVNREIRQQISWKHWKKPYKTINYDKLYLTLTDLWYRFMILSAFVFDNVDEIVNVYTKKNIENIRRQKYNY